MALCAALGNDCALPKKNRLSLKCVINVKNWMKIAFSVTRSCAQAGVQSYVEHWGGGGGGGSDLAKLTILTILEGMI